MARFYNGQPVRCIRSFEPMAQGRLKHYPRLGERYTVDRYCSTDDNHLVLREVPTIQHPYVVFWGETFFAPIQDDVVQELLRVAVTEREPVDA